MDEIGLLFGIGARGIERLLVVVFAGLSIYFGYRLFLALPINDHKGEIAVPGFKVVLTKAGPGVFFAAFGSAILIAAFTNPVDIDFERGSYAGAMPAAAQDLATMPDTPEAGLEPARERVRLALQTLNCLPGYAAAASANLAASDIELAVRDAKVALLQGVWKSGEWGEYDVFVAWSKTGQGAIPDELRAWYLARNGC